MVATATLLVLLVWFALEIHGGTRLGLSERVLAAAEACRPLAVAVALDRSLHGSIKGVMSARRAGRKSVQQLMVDATGEPADLATLAKRRRITHLTAAVLLLVMIVALVATPNDHEGTTTVSLIGGFSAILLIVAGVVSVQYSVRIARRRRTRANAMVAPVMTAGSAAYQPIQQLDRAHELLQSVLPEIESVRKGIGATAEKTRTSLEQTGRRVLLQERVLAAMTGSARPDARHIAAAAQLATMTSHLQSGVDRYVNLAQQAALTATSLGQHNPSLDLQDATDQLAGLAQGLKEVREISDDFS